MVRRWGVVVAAVVLVACGGGDDDAARRSALADALTTDAGGDLDEAQASCVAAGLLELVGPEELDELEEAPGEFDDAELDELGLDAGDDDGEDAEDVADLVADCDVDLDDVDVDDLGGLSGDVVLLALHGAYVDGIEDVLGRSGELDDLARGERSCLARAVVVGVGVDVIAEAGSPDEVADAEEVADLDLDAARAIDDIADEAEGCDVDLGPLADPVLEELAFDGFGDVDCLEDTLEPSSIDRLAVVALVLGAEEALFDPEPISDLIEEISDALLGCEPEFDDDFELPEFDDEEYVDAVEEALLGDPGHPVAPEPAACTAQAWVDQLGEGFLLEEVGLFPEDLVDLDDYPDLFFLDEEAEAFVDAATTCTLPLADLSLALLDTPAVTPEQAGCYVALLVDPAVTADFVLGHLSGELELEDPASLAVSAALAGCGIAS